MPAKSPAPIPPIPPELRAHLSGWLTDHPAATLLDIEQTINAELDQLRSAMIETALSEVEAATAACCPTCGHALQPRGRRDRTLRLPGDLTVSVTRRYGHCPVCETGVFPPR